MNQQRKNIEFMTAMSNYWFGMMEIFLGIIILFFVFTSIFTSSPYYEQMQGNSRNIFYAVVAGFYIACIAAYIPVRNYFRRKYGRVEAKQELKNPALKKILIIAAAAAILSLVTRIDGAFYLPFSVTLITLSVYFVGIWYFSYRGISNTLLYCAPTIFLAGFLPWNWIYTSLAQAQYIFGKKEFFDTIYLGTLGLTSIISGVTTRLILSKIMNPSVGQKEEIYESI